MMADVKCELIIMHLLNLNFYLNYPLSSAILSLTIITLLLLLTNATFTAMCFLGSFIQKQNFENWYITVISNLTINLRKKCY